MGMRGGMSAVNTGAGKLLESYYSRTINLRSNFKKWFLFSFISGALIGLIVAGIHIVIYDEIWYRLRDITTSSIYGSIYAFVLPVIGILAAAYIVDRFAVNPGIHSTEEVIQAYHEDDGQISLASFPAKVVASILTIGFGGSAGMEGPSIYVGASIASWMRRRLVKFGFSYEDARWMLLAGGAAGIAAIFKAPLTGVVFGLEVPYKDDMARDALIPSLIASVTSYIVFVSIVGITPLFQAPRILAVDYHDLLLSVILGLVCGLAARLFVFFFKWSSGFLRRNFHSALQRAIIGSSIVGLTGLVSIIILEAPYALGSGYEAINGTLAGKMAAWQLFALFILKAAGTSATMAAGGVGGVFIPMIVMGASIGGAMGELASSRGSLFPVLGMAAFLSAGYSTPLAAATFVAETTGSPGFIIPGLIAAAMSYTVFGRHSVSAHQRFHRKTILHKILEEPVRYAMSGSVITVPSGTTVEEFIHDYFMKYRHKSFPISEGDSLTGMVAFCDIRHIPPQDWAKVEVNAVAVKNVITASPDQSLAEVSELMSESDIDRMPVVDPSRPNKIIGIIASTDIIRLEEISDMIDR
jgi:CIC family chloride channel protein